MSEEFLKPVDTKLFPNYRNFIVKPMDLSLLEENIRNNLYGSTEAFLAEAKWILHNCVIFNSVHSKFTNVARALLKICRQEMLEIENCPDCYQSAHTRSSDSWFIEVCRKPHILVWAKLKGFPFWPAKAMSTNNENQVDVRFFGAHDRAWVPVSACYLYSKMPPVPSSKKKNNLEECIKELEAHIKKLRDRFGEFEHAPYKTIYDPTKEDEQLALLLPKYDNKQLTARVGRLIHDRTRPSITTPEKKEADLKIEKQETQKDKVDRKVLQTKQFSGSKQKRKASVSYSPSRGPKSKCLEQIPDVERSMSIDTDNENDDTALSSDNDDFNSTSPPKFFISKLGLQKNNTKVSTTGSSNETKIAFVDKLQEKLSRLENTNKECENSLKESEAKSVVVVDNKEKEVDSYADVTLAKSVVLLHDLKNTKVLNEQFKNSNTVFEVPDKVNNKDNTEEKHDEIKPDLLNNSRANLTANKDVIEIDSSSSSIAASENGDDVTVCNENKDRNVINKKKNNINNVVETIKERRSSVDTKAIDTIETNVNTASDLPVNTTTDKDVGKDTELVICGGIEEEQPASVNTGSTPGLSNDENEVTSTRPDPDKVMLDNNDYPLVVIDKAAADDDSSSSSVKELPITSDLLKSCLEHNDKPGVDKNRRKGKPAKVCSKGSVDEDEISRRNSDSCKKPVDVNIDSVLDEVSGNFTNICKSLVGVPKDVSSMCTMSTSSSEGTNVTINVLSDESMLTKKPPKEIRASVNLSKDVSLSVVGDITSTLDMECVSDSEDTVVLNEDIPDVQQSRPTARKSLPVPITSQRLSVAKTVAKPPQQRKSVDLTEGIKLCSPQSLQNIRSPPINSTVISTTEPKKANTSAPLKLQNGHTNVNPATPIVPARNTQTPRTLPPLLKSSQTPAPVLASGPLNAHLNKLSQKMSGRFRTMFEELLKELSLEGCTEATIKGLQLEMERMQWRHRQEIAELKHNTDLVVMEVRASLESEKQKVMLETKQKLEQEKEIAVQETKRKQWCAFCQKEALLYCCWNTAYCSYPCQQSHWLHHISVCAQSSLHSGNDNAKQGNNVSGVLGNSTKSFSNQNQPQKRLTQNSTNIKLGVGGSFMQINVPATNRNMTPRSYGHTPQFMPIMHHTPR